MRLCQKWTHLITCGRICTIAHNSCNVSRVTVAAAAEDTSSIVDVMNEIQRNTEKMKITNDNDVTTAAYMLRITDD